MYWNLNHFVCPFQGVANRGASIRVGRETEQNGKGYFEDRRPASNMDPYVVTSLIADTTILWKPWKVPNLQQKMCKLIQEKLEFAFPFVSVLWDGVPVFDSSGLHRMTFDVKWCLHCFTWSCSCQRAAVVCINNCVRGLFLLLKCAQFVIMCLSSLFHKEIHVNVIIIKWCPAVSVSRIS